MRDPQDVDVLGTTPGRRWTNRLSLAVAIAALVVLIDQLTKQWALATLEQGPCSQTDACIELVAGARLRLVFNNGAAFATGGDFGPLFGVLAFLMTFLLLYLAAKQTRLRGLLPFAAIAGGAVGNLLDRFFRADDGFLTGAVVDFVDVGWWPVFNVADSAIVVGVIAVIVFTMLEPDDQGATPDPDTDPAHETANGDVDSDRDPAGDEPRAGDRYPVGDEQPDEGEPSLTT